MGGEAFAGTVAVKLWGLQISFVGLMDQISFEPFQLNWAANTGRDDEENDAQLELCSSPSHRQGFLKSSNFSEEPGTPRIIFFSRANSAPPYGTAGV